MKFKESLIAMHLTEVEAERVLAELDGKFIPKGRFNALNAELKRVKEQLIQKEQQILKLKDAAVALPSLQEEIIMLKNKHIEEKQLYTAELKKMRREATDKELQLKAKLKNLQSVLSVLKVIKEDLDNYLSYSEKI